MNDMDFPDLEFHLKNPQTLRFLLVVKVHFNVVKRAKNLLKHQDFLYTLTSWLLEIINFRKRQICLTRNIIADISRLFY